MRRNSKKIPAGKHLFYGHVFKYDWDSVVHLLGKRTDKEIAARLGCNWQSVMAMRNRLNIPRFRKSDRIRRLMGRHTDEVVAEMCGCHRQTVARQRRAEGMSPAPRSRRRDVIRAKHERRMAALEAKSAQNSRLRSH